MVLKLGGRSKGYRMDNAELEQLEKRKKELTLRAEIARLERQERWRGLLSEWTERLRKWPSIILKTSFDLGVGLAEGAWEGLRVWVILMSAVFGVTSIMMAFTEGSVVFFLMGVMLLLPAIVTWYRNGSIFRF